MKGFTLVELLIYVGIFAIVGVGLVSILVTFVKIDVQQSAGSEIAGQANFILQKIQNTISNASFLVVNDDGNDEVDGTLAQTHSYLVIKAVNERSDPSTENDANSPITIYKEGDFVKIKQGQGAPNYVSINNLNGHKIKVANLTFTKVSNPPGRDVVLINLSLQYNSANPTQQVTRNFVLGVSKASAAVFDTALQPGASVPSQLDMGTATNRWRHLFLAGDLNVNGLSTMGNGSDAIAYLRHAGNLSVDPPSIAANSNNTQNIALLGISAGDQIFLTPPSSLETGLVLVGASTLAGSVDITLRNTTGAAINGIARNWYYFVVR